MDFSIEYIMCFNEKLKKNKENKQWYQYQLNKNVLKVLNKRKQIMNDKIIDLDTYKPLSLREKVILKQKRQFPKDSLSLLIKDLKYANHIRYNALRTYISYPLYEYRNKRFNIVRCSVFYKEEALYNYKKYKPKTYDLIIRLLLISKNYKNLKSSYDNRKMLFKLRCCKKLINFMYIPKNRNIKININDEMIKLLNEPININ